MIAPEPTMSDVVQELTAIRELLTEMRDHQQQEAVCPHGSTGFCMHCLLPTVDQLASNIGATVFEAVRKR